MTIEANNRNRIILTFTTDGGDTFRARLTRRARRSPRIDYVDRVFR